MSKRNFLGSWAIDNSAFLFDVFSKYWIGNRLWHHHIDASAKNLF